jgi:acetyltransferase-like isoleucine patch superfamily enzyme
MAYESNYNQELTKDLVRWFRLSELHRIESLVIAFFGWIPLLPGRTLRGSIYRIFLRNIGTSVKIDQGVELFRTKGIHLEDRVRISRDVRIGCYGRNSQIKLEHDSILDRGVDIKTHWSGKIQVGARTYIGPYTCLSGDSIKIGQNCMIASHSGIYANDHVFSDLSRPIKEQGNSYKGITIEDDCWLGSGVRVLDGVTIGKGSVIGAGAVVTKNIPPYSIAVGVPAKVVSKRDSTSK